MRPRSGRLTLLLMVVTAGAGLAFRYGRLGLPQFAVKYGGSAMWALMIYWIVSAVLGRWRVGNAALLAGAVAAAVEFFKLYRSPGMDAFRTTLPGVLVLGRHFAWWDIAAYWIAIAAGAWADVAIRRRRRSG